MKGKRKGWRITRTSNYFQPLLSPPLKHKHYIDKNSLAPWHVWTELFSLLKLSLNVKNNSAFPVSPALRYSNYFLYPPGTIFTTMLSFRWQRFLWMNFFPWLSLYHLDILFCVFVPDQNTLKLWHYYSSLYRKLQLDGKPHPKQSTFTQMQINHLTVRFVLRSDALRPRLFRRRYVD